jgi:preprotein translocase subunit SecA
MAGIFSKFFGDSNTKIIKKYQSQIEAIKAHSARFSELTDADFPKQTALLRERIAKGESLDSILSEAFALVQVASERTLGWRHYDVQLIGGVVLHEGKIAEMRTGEGKTLVATLPVFLNALVGKGVHVVTVNDYLARRDAVWMGQVYAFLGLSIGVVNSLNQSYIYDSNHKQDDEKRDEVGAYKVLHEFLRPVTRKEAYAADITYGTNNEFGFDYLRDNLATRPDGMVQRGHAFAIVDEIDSILIDESRTPLIISSESGNSDDFYKNFARIAQAMVREDDFTVDEKLRAITLTDKGITKAEQLLGIDNIYTEKGIKYVHHLETAIRARALFLKDKDYVVRDNEVVIVDAFTGRLQPGRRWSDGLHQAIEAKENVPLQKETRAVASITFQNYFRFYGKLSGMTGTALTSAEEFYKVYKLEVVPIPTNKPIARIDHNDQIFQTEQGKFKAVARKVRELHEKGQPVLIGTVSIEKNELLSEYLTAEGVPHTILNAKNHEKEGEIIANAGKEGSVTLATNMAGRGIDIKLGGIDATQEKSESVKQKGGLFVLGTERHEARRIDNQLRGRAGRQGDPGETQFYVSLEDDLMRIFGAERIKTMMGRFGIPEDQPIENRFINRALENAQTKIEGFHFDARKHTLEYDDVMNHQRNTIYARRKEMLLGDKEHVKNTLETIIAGNSEFSQVVEEKITAYGEEPFYDTTRRIILYVTDALWVEHLETMEYTRSAVNLRAYGQREPLIEYKKEALRLFKEMEDSFKEQVMNLIKTMTVEAKQPEPIEAQEVTIAMPHEDINSDLEEAMKKAGRNDLCPCGSGKKFKYCHGK